tara:strand:+ start:481 stop:669 length:189 start_codon:yes stop_codon:yes gene_type:complete
MIGRMLTMTLGVGVASFAVGASVSSFKHYYKRFADNEDLNDGTVTQVAIVADNTKKSRGRKS